MYSDIFYVQFTKKQ